MTLTEALDALGANTALAGILGQKVVDVFTLMKRDEVERYEQAGRTRRPATSPSGSSRSTCRLLTYRSLQRPHGALSRYRALPNSAVLKAGQIGCERSAIRSPPAKVTPSSR